METNIQNRQLVFDHESHIYYTKALQAVAAEQHLLPFIQRIAQAQQFPLLQAYSQQVWAAARVVEGIFLVKSFAPPCILLFSGLMKQMPMAVEEVVLWFDDGVLMLPEEK